MTPREVSDEGKCRANAVITRMLIHLQNHYSIFQICQKRQEYKAKKKVTHIPTTPPHPHYICHSVTGLLPRVNLACPYSHPPAC